MNFQKYILNQHLAQLDLSSKRIYSVKNTDMEYDFGEISQEDFDKISTDIEVAFGIFQSKEDYEANMAYDEERDNQL